MEHALPSQLQLVGPEIHGFKTMKDLDVPTMFEEAKTRWLRPNEIHAILCNHKYFNIHVKPMNLPKSGTIVLFDRKMLRNFRRDGHNWKKKKDGKTVKEAHEHLKVGNDERIHVYYAHGEVQSTFVRRCYWLLDKKLEHIVLVHYRDTQELQDSPKIESHSSSDPPTSWNLSEENDGIDQVHYAEPNETIINHEMRLHEINTLDWDELVVPEGSNKLITTEGGNMSYFDQDGQYGLNGFVNTMLQSNDTSLQNNSTFMHKLLTNDQPAPFHPETVSEENIYNLNFSNNMGVQRAGTTRKHSNLQMQSKLVNVSTDSLDSVGNDGLKNQDGFGRWMNYTMTESPVVIDGPTLAPEPLVSTGQGTVMPSSGYNQQSQSLQQIFSITDISPPWASSHEETKILVVGVFHEEHRHLANSNLYCVCGDICVPAEVVQPGVFRSFVSRHSPGIVNLFISYDGHKPISQLVTFEYRAPPPINKPIISSEEKSEWEDFQNMMRLAHLLFSSSKSLNILSSKIPPKALKEARVFADRTRSIVNTWDVLINSITTTRISFQRAKNSLLELTLNSRLLEWLLEKILDGGKIPDRDDRGQGVIHLCAILDYTWAIFPYSWSGLAIDFRDKSGWTALHWAAHYGRKTFVASLLSAGANANLVTDPTPENPGGCTPADLASKSGYEGLAAFLAEKALLAHFEAMTLAGNVSGSLQCTIPPTDDDFTPNGLTTADVNEEEQYLKDTLAAYRRAADAAARIQAAFREQSFKLKKKALEFVNAEDEARCVVAAMRIQHAFRNHATKKQMAAAVRIQHRFRTWKIRKDFLNKRRQAIKIQAFFRGYQVRREYKKIVWSVGVLEKAILRWRLKRKGFRGLEVAPNEDEEDGKQVIIEEKFFQSSRKQAEERVERSVVRVQAMFRSKRAQEEYRKMKLALNQAAVEYEGLFNPVTNMER